MNDARSKILIFTTCYNERDNIGPMIDGISESVPDADILVVDDNSPDGTWDVIQERAARNPRVHAVKRPGKLGIGSAHKYALFYAMREGYDVLVTMDADFSHDPRAIPSLLQAHGHNVFVTGSRYCPGGRSDYSGYRDVVSRLGNVLARVVLGVKIHELTTYFRVFDVASLKRLPLRAIASSGYSYGVELVYHLRKSGVELREVPIHFVDRTRGASKIPRLQVLKSAVDLFGLGLRRLHLTRDLKPDEFVADACASCGDRVLAMKHFGSRRPKPGETSDADAAEYRCTAVGAADYPPVYTCLACGLEQVPYSLTPPDLESIYEGVVDETYIANRDVRRKTYERCFDRLAPWLPAPSGSLLEVGAYCGLFQLEAVRRGWQAEGVEPSRWAAQYARDVSHANVHQGYLDENRGNLRKEYDVVVSWDVIEHVRRPTQFLSECGTFLKPGSILAISTMDVGHWLPRLLGTRWPWLMNMHLCYFSKKTMKDTLNRAGFELLHSEPYLHYARARHVLGGGLRLLPAFLRGPVSALVKLVPAGWTVPVAFGDIQLFIARKMA
jgi:dolichol-phosphate mannosyltransferase